MKLTPVLKNRWLWFCAMMALTLAAIAQPTNGVPDVSKDALPASTSEFWKYGIAVVVPLIVGLFKKLIPRLPTWVLPVSTPFVGIGLGAILKVVGVSNMPWIDMAQAGGLAVLVRESWNQLVTQNIKGPEASKTKGPSE